jgi:hypothetical protein
MITTTFDALMSHYVWVVVALVGLLWVCGEWRRMRRWRRERKYEVVCRLCACVFRDVSPEPLVVCPSCQALNERRRPRGI